MRLYGNPGVVRSARGRGYVDPSGDAHPSTAGVDLERAGDRMPVRDASMGGRCTEIAEIDGFTVSLAGDGHTRVALALEGRCGHDWLRWARRIEKIA